LGSAEDDSSGSFSLLSSHLSSLPLSLSLFSKLTLPSFFFSGTLQPKVTVQLLDNEDFGSLGHLLAEYPSVLKEKVLLDAK